MSTHNADDKRMKMFDQFARSCLIASVHAFEAASQVERLISHKDMETTSYTSGKTRLASSRLQAAGQRSKIKQLGVGRVPPPAILCQVSATNGTAAKVFALVADKAVHLSPLRPMRGGAPRPQHTKLPARGSP
jgi:hypothetical protein